MSRPPAIHLTRLDGVAFFNLLPETVIRHRLAIMRGAANQVRGNREQIKFNDELKTRGVPDE